MSNTNYDSHTLLNYAGVNLRDVIFTASHTQTPILTAIGGLNGMVQSKSFEFPVSNVYALASAAQTAYDEATAMTAQDRTNKTLTQTKQTCQIMMYKVEVSYKALSNFAMNGVVGSGQNAVVPSWADFQVSAALQELARDLEYSITRGTYQAAANVSTAGQIRGMTSAVSTNAVAAGGSDVDKAMLDDVFQSMVNNGAPFINTMIVCGSHNKTKISDAYANVPMDRNVGGSNITAIEHDFGRSQVAYSPFIATNTILVLELSTMFPVVNPVPGKGDVFLEPLAKTGAADASNLYAHLSYAYGQETDHGKITGTSTS